MKTAKNNSEPNLIINLVLGDWSHDGHGQTDTITISSNLTVKEIEKAYAAGVKKVGVDLTDEVCREYEDNLLLVNDYKKLIAAGFDKELIDGPEDDSDEEMGYSIYIDEFVKIYLFIVSQGNPEFRYEIVKPTTNSICIGGYGLFSS